MESILSLFDMNKRQHTLQTHGLEPQVNRVFA
jgi:hypothetical protein